MSLKIPFSFKDFVETLSYTVVVIGAFFALYQYFEMKDSNKIKETLAYEQRLNDGEFLTAKISINEAWQPYQSFFEQLRQKTVKSEEDRDEIINKIIQPIIKQKKLNKDIDLIVDFYDSLFICVKNNICDQKTALSFFSTHAKRFYGLHRFYIKNQNKYIVDYGKGLEIFIKQK